MRFPWSYAKRVLAGAIFGLYMAHLLYYLNPQIDITPGRLIAVTVIYGVLCGLIFGSILWGLRALRVRVFGRDEEGPWRPHGFGLVVTAAFFSALVYWAHLALLRVYLPTGAVRILSKATTVIAVTGALLLILWLIERASGKRASRILFTTGVALIVVSSFFLYQRRDRYRVETRNPVIANVAVGPERRVVFVAVRELPYDWIVTLRGEGALPFLSGAVEDGFLARVEPFRTTSPKALWASLNTGKLPSRHGVTGRFSYQTPLNRPNEPFLLVPMGVGFKGWGLIPPVERIAAHLPSGRSLPFWAAWRKLGLEAEVIGWGQREQERERVAPMPRAADRGPGEPAEALANSLPGEVEESLIRALASDAARVDAAVRSARSAALLAVELDAVSRAIDVLGIDDNRLPDRHTPAGKAIRSVLLRIDLQLRDLAEAAGDGLFAVASPSAPKPPVLPGTVLAILRAIEAEADPGTDDGFLLLLGSSVTSRPKAPSVEVTDVVPTILFGGGLPVARDMDGRVVEEGFTDEFLRRSSIAMIQTYESDGLVVQPAEPTAPHSAPQVSAPRS